MLYDMSDEILKGLYKSASFIVQAIVFKETGNYIRRQEELLKFACPAEKQIIDTFLSLKNGAEVDFQTMSESLFTWCQNWIDKIK